MRNIYIDRILADLKAHVPEAGCDIAEVRQVFSEFYKKYQSPLLCQTKAVLGEDFIATWVFDEYFDRTRALIFFHGGGFSIGSTDDHMELIARLAHESRIPILSVDYRLAPEHRFPSDLDDALDAYQWLQSQGFSPNDIMFVGISAGANLVLSLLLKLKQAKLAMPRGSVVISPEPHINLSVPSLEYNANRDWITKERVLSIQKSYLPDTVSVDDPLISPLNGDFGEMPPMLIQVGDAEILFDQVVLFFQKLKSQSVDVNLEVWPDMVHCWHIFARDVPQGQEAIQSIARFISLTFE